MCVCVYMCLFLCVCVCVCLCLYLYVCSHAITIVFSQDVVEGLKVVSTPFVASGHTKLEYNHDLSRSTRLTKHDGWSFERRRDFVTLCCRVH